MIVVTGTKRSGTSMCMQLLQALGYRALGKAFPGTWGETIREANEGGFFETFLRQGVYYSTNPHPYTRRYLHHEDTREHVVKVFARGFVRTHRAFLDATLMTMRPWRQYVRSLNRLETMEAQRLKRSPAARNPTDAAMDWWSENFMLLRELRFRRLKHELTTYERILREPSDAVRNWSNLVSVEHLETAAKQVRQTRRTQWAGEEVHVELDPRHLQVFDEVYAWVDGGGRSAFEIPAPLIERMRQTQRALQRRTRSK